MHWLGYNDAIYALNEAETQIFQLTANLEIFEIYLYFVCLPACHTYVRMYVHMYVRSSCARCRAPEISHYKGNGGRFTKMLFRRRFTHCTMIIPSLSLFFFIPLARCESHLRR